MATFIHSILQPNVAVAADGQIAYDLPVNPLTALIIHLTPLNNTATITDYQHLAGLFSAIDTINITFQGNSIVNISGADMLALLISYWGIVPSLANATDDNNERRSIAFPVPLGRRLYDPDECFPATKRGELQALLTWDIADTGFDALAISLETIELPDANPPHVTKYTTLNQTFAATGDNDVDLPIGNLLRGVLCFGTTGFTGAAPAPTLGQLQLLINNRNSHYTSTDFSTSRLIRSLGGRNKQVEYDHLHALNAAGAGQEDTREPMSDAQADENYTFLDLDPTRDDLYSIDTAGAGRINLRIDADAANAARFVPVERVLVSDLLTSPGGV